MTEHQYPGFNVLLEGPAGTGKTFALSTLVKAGLEVFVLFLEPGVEALIAPWADKGEPVPENLHWHIMPSRIKELSTIRSTIDKVGRMTLKMLANDQDPFRGMTNPVLPVIDVVNNFIDHRTGKEFGPVSSWGTDRVFVIDHLTALSDRFLDMMVGAKPVRDKPDYGIAQTNFMNVQDYLINGCSCHFVMIAHVGRHVDEISGGYKNMTLVIGAAIAEKVPIPYSDVILSRRVVDKWYWDTVDDNTDLKTRNLPYESKLSPDFRLIFEKWKKRKAAGEKV